MTSRALLLESPALDVPAQMALDEAVLDRAADGADGTALILRFFRWRGGGATFGFSQRWEDAAAEVRRARGGITDPLVRRLTGGGLVYHDGDVTFSFVFPWDRLSAPSLVYKNLHVAAHLGLKAHGVETRLWSPGHSKTPAGAAPRAVCFAGPETADLVLEDGSKVLGGALRRRRGWGLYQGSLRPEAFGVPAERLRRALLEGFGLHWRTIFEPRSPAAAAAAAAERLRQERYSQDHWNQRR